MIELACNDHVHGGIDVNPFYVLYGQGCTEPQLYFLLLIRDLKALMP